MSEWHKWDLHIHTPETKMHDGFKDKKGKKTDKNAVWERYCEALNSYNADVLGITDYFSADNFFKLSKNRKKWDLNDKIVLFPNIEIRVNDLVSKKRVDSNKTTSNVNIHIIFQPEVTEKEINKFLSYLTITKTDGQHLNFKDDLKEIIEKDKQFAYLPTTSNLLEALRETFGEHYRENVLLMIPNSGDGINLKNGNGYGNGKDFVTGYIDFLQARTGKAQEDRDYTLTEANDYGRIFASITGCDAHSIEAIEDFPTEATTWIKADKTFEGLKQITYEPKTRVKIQELKPQKSMQTKVIKSIDLLPPYFNKKHLVFSEGLNTIIGGRSSGKSILLSIIANVSSDQENFKLSGQRYNELVNKLSEKCKLTFADGRVSDGTDQIEFIYQDGLQEIARDNQKQNKFLKETLATITGTEIEEVQAAEEDFRKEKRDKMTQLTEKLRLIDQGIEKEKEKLKEQQSDDLIKKNICVIEDKLKQIKKESSILDEERFKVLNNKIKKFGTDIDEKNTLYQNLEQAHQLKAIEINPQLEKLKNKIPSLMIEEIEIKITELNEQFANKVQEGITTTKTEIENKKAEQNKLIEGKYYQNYLRIQEKSPDIKALEESLQQQEQELSSYRKSIKIIDRLVSDRKKCLKELEKSFTFGHMLKKIMVYNNEELNIEYGLRINLDKFKELCKETFKTSTRIFRDKLNGDFLDERSTALPAQFLIFFSKCLKFSYSKDDIPPFRAGHDIYKFINDLSNMTFLEAQYTITYKGQDFSEMSEGKQAFILLLIKLSLTKEEKPLLIDQPEDELDNKAIYDDLVSYFRKQKENRQLFVVTHNANIVVGGDSECITVAEEKNDQASPSGYCFNYSQGSIEDKRMQSNICEILEGGKRAFRKREQRYMFSRS